jgi:hypothetical protein
MKPVMFGAAILISALLLAQDSGFQVNTTGCRSLSAAVRLLREKTGWPISLEEPVWPSKSVGGPGVRVTEQGFQVDPPSPDRLQVLIPSLRGVGAQAKAIGGLLSAFNSQNSAVSYKTETLGDMTVLEADMMLNPAGTRAVAPLILSTTIHVPVAQRSPNQHLAALAAAVQQQTGIPVMLDTAGFGFAVDVPFTGKNGPARQAQDFLLNWGTPPQTARLALLDLLSRSKTTTIYQVDCQAGVNSAGECILSVDPLIVEVVGRSGTLKKKVLYFDRGRPDMELPPEPDY